MKKTIFSIAMAALLFSTMEIALKLFSLNFNPLQINLIRFTMGSLILLPSTLGRLKHARIDARDLGFFALSGFIGVVVSMTLYQMAVLRTPASTVAILFSCNPVFVIPLAAIVLGERIGWRTLLSLLASLVGIGFILNPFHMSADAPGIALTLLSALTFALYGVFGKTRSLRLGSVSLTCLSFAAGSLELLALMLLSWIGPLASALRNIGLASFAAMPILRGVTLASLPSLLYLGVFVTGLGYTFYFLAMESSSASNASIVFFIKPALAPILALLILHEALPAAKIAGIAFILFGSIVGLLPRRAKADTGARGTA